MKHDCRCLGDAPVIPVETTAPPAPIPTGPSWGSRPYSRIPWKPILIGGGALGLLLLLVKGAKASTGGVVVGSLTGINPLDYSVPDPTAPLAKYKPQLVAKVLDPAIRAEVEAWSKDKILAQLGAIIPNQAHANIIKGILKQESGFFPAALAGWVFSYDNIKKKDGSPESTAFGATQITRQTFEDVGPKTKFWRALPFRHEDLWFPPFMVEATYKVLLHKGLTKNPKAALKSYRGSTAEVQEKYATAVLATAGVAA